MNTILKSKHILLGITGGIAAYKIPELIRLLIASGAEVRAVLTEGGSNFVAPETLRVLSGHYVYQSLWDENKAESISHIELARWADVVLIAPATANSIAKLAHGFADDLLSTLFLATTSPIIILPAMNKIMWQNKATQSNLALLKSRDVSVWGPDNGIQACGDTGLGRMCEPDKIIQHLTAFFVPKYFTNKKILITAGPTQEPIDPVRYMTNYSSGKMGYALAEAAFEAGAEVTLISGPVFISCHPEIHKINIMTAIEMQNAVIENIAHHDIFISAAAVSDYRSESVSSHKIKKYQQNYTIKFTQNPDILTEISHLSLPHKPIIIGFAAETENLAENAYNKLKAKKLDMIIGNLVGDNKGFQSDDNQLLILTDKMSKNLEYASKQHLSRELMRMIYDTFKHRSV